MRARLLLPNLVEHHHHQTASDSLNGTKGGRDPTSSPHHWHDRSHHFIKISICHLNIRSLPKHFNELCHTQDILNHDIICLSETWLNSSHPSSHYQIPNYTLLSKDRGMSSRGGGLAIYIKNSIAFNFAHIFLPKTECLSVDINSKQSKICIIACDLKRFFESRNFHEPTVL